MIFAFLDSANQVVLPSERRRREIKAGQKMSMPPQSKGAWQCRSLKTCPLAELQNPAAHP